MRPEPWYRLRPQLLLVAVPMALLRAGRVVCLQAQRVPALVALVRAVRAHQARRAARRDRAATGT